MISSPTDQWHVVFRRRRRGGGGREIRSDLSQMFYFRLVSRFTARGSVGQRHLRGTQLENVAGFQLPVLHVLARSTPQFAVPWLEADAFLFHLLLLLFSAVKQFELVKRCPAVADVGLQFDRAIEPFARLVQSTFGPEEFRHCHENMRVMFALLQGVDTLRFALDPRFHEDRLGPENPCRRTLLHA